MRDLYARGFDGNPHSRTIVVEQVIGGNAVVAERWPARRGQPKRMTVPLSQISRGSEGQGVTLDWLKEQGWEPVS